MIGAAVLGCGTVGSGVVKMLTDNREWIRRAAGQEICLKYVVDIREVDLPEGVELTGDFDKVLADDEVRVCVETIGGARIAYDYTRRALASGRTVVTSNKELVASHGDELIRLAEANGARYLYEASVGGGVPIVRPMENDLSGNRIRRVMGIVNGSTNYLLTRMEDTGASFDVALQEAKRLGYVEANPSADIDGHDARRKLAILAHTAFGSALADEALIPTTGISAVTEDDLKLAHAAGATVKLIARGERTADGWNGWVHPALVPVGHPLYAVRDVFNGILVNGDFVDDVMFYGRGAGSLATASACVGDVIDAARGAKAYARFEAVAPFDAAAAVEMRAFVRVPEGTAIPEGCRTVEAEGLRAVLTPALAPEALDELIRSLRTDAQPMYVI